MTVQNPATTYTLRIINGGLNNTQFPRVTGATVTLNGVTVAMRVLSQLRTTYAERFPGFRLTRFDGAEVTL